MVNEELKKWYALFADMALSAQQHGLSVTVHKSRDTVWFQVSQIPTERTEGQRLSVKK